jgi:hypothetical protein
MRKILIVLMIGCFLLGWATKEEVEGVKEEAEKEVAKDTVADTLTQMQDKDENGYRIEVAEEKLRGGENEEELRFISPEGNVVKAIPYVNWQDRARITVSPDSRYLIQSAVLSSGSEEKNPEVEISFVDAKGEDRWSKSFEVEYMLSQTHEGDQMPYFFRVSKDGSAIAFIRSHDTYKKDWWSDIIVFDTLGNEIASVSHVPPQMEGSPSDFEISPDGKIIGAVVFPQSENESNIGRHFFFLDVETGETKLVKAEGEGWEVWFSLLTQFETEEGVKSLPSKHVKIWWKIKGKRGKTIISFDEIPLDISTLFGDWK